MQGDILKNMKNGNNQFAIGEGTKAESVTQIPLAEI